MTKCLRIWHLVSNRWYSAISEYALRSAMSLQMSEQDCLFSPLSGKPLHKKAAQLDLQLRPFESFHPLPSILSQFIKVHKQFDPDVIVTYGGPESILARFFSSKPVVRFRGKNEDFNVKNLSKIHQLRIKSILVPSESLRSHISQNTQTNVDAVNLGLDTRYFRFQKELISSVVRPTIRVIGRLDPVKGHRNFLKIFRKLLEIWTNDLPKPFLEIIGQPANVSENEIHQWAQSLALEEGEDYRLLAERVNDLPSILAKTHLGVICSEGSEVICRVAEEFLLCGVPLFVSGVGSLNDCLFSPLAGQSYFGLTTDQAADNLLKMLRSAFSEEDISRSARAEAAALLFSDHVMGAKLLDVLKKVCDTESVS